MSKVPITPPSSEYAHVVPDWRYMAKVCAPVVTCALPPAMMVSLFRFHT
jgi:hypothetical protein